jgi:hypothetical protein
MQVHEVPPPDEVPTNEEDPLQGGQRQDELSALSRGGSGDARGLPPAANAEGGTVGGGGGAMQVRNTASCVCPAEPCAVCDQHQPRPNDCAVACRSPSLLRWVANELRLQHSLATAACRYAMAYMHAFTDCSKLLSHLLGRWAMCRSLQQRRGCAARGRAPAASRAGR